MRDGDGDGVGAKGSSATPVDWGNAITIGRGRTGWFCSSEPGLSQQGEKRSCISMEMRVSLLEYCRANFKDAQKRSFDLHHPECRSATVEQRLSTCCILGLTVALHVLRGKLFDMVCSEPAW
jgi:hypothetical protein